MSITPIKISENLFLAPFVTFEISKTKAIYNWFYYKEAFSPELVEWAITREKITEQKENVLIADPFCGIGTTVLRAKVQGLKAIGLDASPLAVFISQVKTRDYSKDDISNARQFVEKVFEKLQKNRNNELKETKGENRFKWHFELFDPRACIPKSNLNIIEYLREEIENLDEKVGGLMLLALLSILPQCSLIVKDGGVLKIDRSKRAIPVKDAFRKKVKNMLTDLEGNSFSGSKPEIHLDDARICQSIKDESVDLIVTSPPYLNNIDYSKVYGLELSLLGMSKEITKETRTQMVRSFITLDKKIEKMPPEVGEIGEKIPIIGTYFYDMELTLKQIHRILKPGKACYFNVANSVIYETHVLVDEVLAEMAERIGFKEVEIIVAANRLADVKPKKINVRESIIVMRK
ncbi:MAG: hypothetical protein AABX38_01425 [Candidatus Micrarchaeota archaeon]